jgi:hypothetical protein
LLKAVVIVAGFWSGVMAQAPNDASLQQLYERHNWFELRDALAEKTAPALYAGAVASAFNRTADADRYLNRAVREASTPDAANEAREALLSLYMRLGRSSDTIGLLDDAIAAVPSREDFRNVRGLFGSLRRFPNQTARTGKGEPFPCAVSTAGVVLPVAVNGKAVDWLFDSGFSHSALSESEARLLGLRVESGTGEAGDFASGTTSTRLAVAPRVTIGDAELRNVPMLVFADSQPPWNEQPAGKRGTIGIPVAAALQGIHWTNRGACQWGANARRRAGADINLVFDGMTPVTRVQFEGRPLEFVLDTGNQGGTQLWQRFAQDFPALVSRGQKSTKQVSQIGGSEERQIVVLPELRLRVGGFDSLLRPAHVFSKPIGNELQHGNLGMDILSQAADVTIDFQSMSLTVR